MLGWFLDLLGLLYYSTVGKKAIPRGGKLSAAHTCDLFYVHKVIYCAKVNNRVLVWFLGLVDLQWHTTIGIKAIWAVSNISDTHAFD